MKLLVISRGLSIVIAKEKLWKMRGRNCNGKLVEL